MKYRSLECGKFYCSCKKVCDQEARTETFPRVAKSRTSLRAHGCSEESLAEDGLFYSVGIVRSSSRLSMFWCSDTENRRVR